MFYATVKIGTKTGYLAGPYRTHGAALWALAPATRVARRLWPYETFDARFGTSRVRTPAQRRRVGRGLLNDRIPQPKDALP